MQETGQYSGSIRARTSLKLGSKLGPIKVFKKGLLDQCIEIAVWRVESNKLEKCSQLYKKDPESNLHNNVLVETLVTNCRVLTN